MCLLSFLRFGVGVFSRVVDLENKAGFLSTLKDNEQRAVARNLGQLYYFNPKWAFIICIHRCVHGPPRCQSPALHIALLNLCSFLKTLYVQRDCSFPGPHSLSTLLSQVSFRSLSPRPVKPLRLSPGTKTPAALQQGKIQAALCEATFFPWLLRPLLHETVGILDRHFGI